VTPSSDEQVGAYLPDTTVDRNLWLGLCRRDLEQPDERRLIRFVEDVDNAEPPATAEEQLLADLDPVWLGRLA
jgi:hypothetical protein